MAMLMATTMAIHLPGGEAGEILSLFDQKCYNIHGHSSDTNYNKKITENYILPQICCLNEKVSHEEVRSSRDEEALVKLKQRMEVIGMRRKAKEEKKKGN